MYEEYSEIDSKQLRPLSHSHLKGATRRKLPNKLVNSKTTTISLYVKARNDKWRHVEKSNENIDRVNEKYSLNFMLTPRSEWPNVPKYSLDKKNRWELLDELVDEVIPAVEADNDDVDVRVIETRNRGYSTSSNCLSIRSIVDEAVEVKRGYANLNSILKQQEIKAVERNLKSKGLGVNKRDDYCIEYEIQYPTQSDVLKYAYKTRETKEPKVKSKLRRRHVEIEDDEEFNEEYDDEITDERQIVNNSQLKVDLDDLIEKSVEKKSLREYRSYLKKNSNN